MTDRGEVTSGRRRGARALVALMLAGASLALSPLPASALSEIKREELPTSPSPAAEKESPFPGNAVPLPGPIQMPRDRDAPAGANDGEPRESEDLIGPEEEPDTALPEILYDLTRLPEPARRMHGLILEACRSGDIEALRPLIGPGEDGTQLSFSASDSDPIAFLKELSGDDDGHEILAILQEVLGAGFVHLDAGAESELYVWPYFFAVPLDRLTAPQRVELFTIVTAGDYEDMKAYGAYIFYRVGITPDGRWAFFVAGD